MGVAPRIMAEPESETHTVVVALPSKQVGVLLAASLVDEARSYVTNFDSGWTRVEVSGSREAVSEGEVHLSSLIERITRDIQTSHSSLHPVSLPLLGSLRGVADVTSVEDLYQVEITFTDRDLPVQLLQIPPESLSIKFLHDHGYVVSRRREGEGRGETFPPVSVTWCRRQRDGTLSPLSTDDSTVIEDLFQCGGSNVLLSGVQCLVDFDQMTVLSETGDEVHLQRQPILLQPPEQHTVVKIKGLSSCVGDALSNLQHRLERGLKRLHIPCQLAGGELPPRLRQQVINFCRGFCVEFEFIASGGVALKGAEGYVGAVGTHLNHFLHTELVQFPSVLRQPLPPKPSFQFPTMLQQISPLHSQLPRSWQPQTEQCVFIPVPQSSAEWKDTLALMRLSMPTVSIKDIQRVQNRPVWERYSLEGRQMTERNQGQIQEKYLFHGTSRTDPYQVARSESGLDFRCSSRERQLMWGQGTYFAVKASYSDRFSYSRANHRQMMLVSVLTGRSYHCGKQKMPSLTRPPEFAAGKLYDTVYAESAESDIYVVYDHCKSCPVFIITYTK